MAKLIRRLPVDQEINEAFEEMRQEESYLDELDRLYMEQWAPFYESWLDSLGSPFDDCPYDDPDTRFLEDYSYDEYQFEYWE